MRIENSNIKFLPKQRLLEIIESLPDNTFLAVNHSGNMVVIEKINEDIDICGYIDFMHEGEYHFVGEEKE